jgi:hypothetical protein
MTPATLAKTAASHAKAVQANMKAFRTSFKDDPQFIERVLGKGKPNIARKVKFKDASGKAQEVTLLDATALVGDLVAARKQIEDPKALAAQYKRVHDALSSAAEKDPKIKEAMSKIASPADLAGQTFKDVHVKLRAALDLYFDFAKPGRWPKLAGYGDCSKEQGGGSGSDMTGPSGIAFNPNGLHERCDWPLKSFNTCVRNQGARGTCSAFATIAAVESRAAAQLGKWVNLSEQDLYKHQRLDWGPIPPDFYDDGYSPPLSLIAQLLTGYKFPFERDWDYNPSPSRVENDSQRKYTHSCDGYSGEACSNTNHQAEKHVYTVDVTTVKTVTEEVCDFVEAIPFLGILGGWVCDVVETTIEIVEQVEVVEYRTSIPGSSNLRAKAFVPFYVPPIDAQLGIDLAKFYLDDQRPVVYCFTVPDSFQSPVSGFVTYSEGETGDGGHCVLLTGYVDNGSLPGGIAPGSGGGYFIVKNSWGQGWGDAGYGYLPYDSVRKWTTHMVTITDVGP